MDEIIFADESVHEVAPVEAGARVQIVGSIYTSSVYGTVSSRRRKAAS